MRTLIERIERACHDHPDLNAIRHRHDSISYRELGEAITNVAITCSTSTFTVVAVTPGAVAPPLLLPAFHGFTQNGPPPTVA